VFNSNLSSISAISWS